MKKSMFTIPLVILVLLFTAAAGGFFALTFANMEEEKAIVQQEKDGKEKNTETEKSEEESIIWIGETLSKTVVGVSNIPALSPEQTKTNEMGIGSGVMIDPRGYIVTNNHVISGADKIYVTLNDGSQRDATVIGSDRRTDLALIKIEGEDFPTAVLGDSDGLKVGEKAIAIGNPGGLDFASSVTTGIISGLNRPLTTEEGLRFKLIQTDAAINPGNSGGALVNKKGEVIGINTIKISQEGFEGMGFAIPANLVKEIVAELMDTGKVTRGAMGVYLLGSIDPEFNAQNKIGTDYGVLISLQPGGPGEKAGLKENDVITKVDDNKIDDIYELQEVIFDHEVGDTVTVTVMRQGKEVTVSVVLGELKD